jgi:cyclase
MKLSTALLARSLFLAALALPAAGQDPLGGFEPPPGWLPPPLDPTGVELETRELGPGVYALLSNRPPVDNSGFVVGERGVLVIDSHLTADMAGAIQAAVRAVTGKPILYLVNTNSHGDHTFGNHAFPADTRVIAHVETARAMQRFEDERSLMRLALGERAHLVDDAELRLPDVTYEDSLRLDLGGRVVELHHFGSGSSPGDTVVYEPESRVAWTGNLILGEGAIPWAIEGGVQAYLETLARFAAALDVETIVPGHVLTTDGEALARSLSYLTRLLDDVRAQLRAGASLEETLAALPLDESFLPAAEGPLAVARPMMQGFHLWNVKRAHAELSAAAHARRSP